MLERFSNYVGTLDDLGLGSDLLDDLGLDSIALVTVLLDVADELDLDLASLVTLAGIDTVADVVALVRSLLDGTTATELAGPPT